jgi:hypothetical protein
VAKAAPWIRYGTILSDLLKAIAVVKITFFLCTLHYNYIHCVVKIMLRDRKHLECIIAIYLILPGALGLGVYSTSSRK